MKQELEQLVSQALASLEHDGVLVLPPGFVPGIERTRDRAHGDFASNAAMVLAKPARQSPRELAQRLVERLPDSQLVDRVEIAGPGFINFFLTPAAYHTVVDTILEQGRRFGRSGTGAGRRVLLEFVSANPTGPLHVGHGRGAAYGATLANLLDAAGFVVDREYYVNDAGRQMDILACSVWLRYLEQGGAQPPFPGNAYRGAYIRDIAAGLRTDHGDAFERPIAELPAPTDTGSEQYLDNLIASAKSTLGDEAYRQVFEFGMQSILDEIRTDLAEFGVEFDRWFTESSLVEAGRIEQEIASLRTGDHLYEADGALWFRATAFGDEKDRVVVRENGQTTYFAADIAYHLDKYERGYDQIIDIWGADHHGYAPRVRAAIQACSGDPDRLAILFVQFATLYRGEERLPMSTRAGEFVTLRELRDEVGRDAARFFYIMRRSDQHLEFDLELAKSQSNDNPVFYIQYAHARICSVLRQMQERGLKHDPAQGLAELVRLTTPEEDHLLVTLSRYPEIIEAAALNREPHQLAYYLRELANEFHVYYNTHQFLVDTQELRNARLSLALAIRRVLNNGLELLGVSAPESM
jgi:arginyl-tRNA synthetase